jgi:predicted O-linked N-acetylglucosamine transferase (SPINDLY family)
MPALPELFARALGQHQARQPQQAEPLLRQVLAAAPRHGGALHLLGVLAYQSGRFGLAADCFRQAAAVHPDLPDCHTALGAAYLALGLPADAERCHRQALLLNPADPAAWNNLGITLAAQGKVEEAAAAFRRALDATPDDPGVLTNLAAALRQAGRPDEALACCEQALRSCPGLAEAHHNRGLLLQDRGQDDDALACFERAVRLQPGFAKAQVSRGALLLRRGRLDGAVAAFRDAVQARPDDADAHSGLGHALLEQQRHAEALDAFRRALLLRPGSAEVHVGLGNVHAGRGELDEAAGAYAQALRLDPGLAVARYDLGVARLGQGRLAEAQDCLRQAIEARPEDHIAGSTYLGSLLYGPAADPAAVLAEHRRWGERHANPDPVAASGPLADSRPSEARKRAACGYGGAPEPGRRLRVGYASPDFRSHAVAAFVEPLLAHHDRSQVEAICYADVAVTDAVTARLRGLADGWRDTLGLTDDEWAERVRADGIDILVDLAGHTAGNRLRAFGRKPAPVQASAFGYPATTGVPAIGYRLGDAVTDPPGEPTWSTEEVLRLPGTFCCYAPPAEAPPVTESPAVRQAVVTFGALHKLEKLNDAVLDLWCRLLREVPASRLLVCRNTLYGGTAEGLRRRFAERGVAAERLLLRRVEPVGFQHLRVYQEIDIALDPFPWNGHTTACEALWMGVPVVALRGRTHAGRMTASVLTSVGLGELVADSPVDYCRVAAELAADRLRLAALRAGMRQRVQASPLCDGPGFVRGLEAAYRTVWRSWCIEHASAGPGLAATA